MVRLLAVACRPVPPDPGRPLAIGKYPRHRAPPHNQNNPSAKVPTRSDNAGMFR
jgi:hypothetical protein